jgi:hypothetical protein
VIGMGLARWALAPAGCAAGCAARPGGSGSPPHPQAPPLTSTPWSSCVPHSASSNTPPTYSWKARWLAWMATDTGCCDAAFLSAICRGARVKGYQGGALSAQRSQERRQAAR